MKRVVSLAAVPIVAVGVSLAASDALAALRGSVVEFGRTEGDSTRAGTDQDAGNGLAPARPMLGTKYVDHSDVIEARLCRSFGITVKISGGAEPQPSRVDARVIHPSFTRPDGETSLEDDFPGFVEGGSTGVGFTFDHLWEMQPGLWRIVVLADGVELASKDFTVIASPPDAPKTDCHGGLAT